MKSHSYFTIPVQNYINQLDHTADQINSLIKVSKVFVDNTQ